MLKTKPEEYEVVGVRRHHLWLEVLRGEDKGLRVSVPLRHPEYDEQMEKSLNRLDEGSMYKFVLVSEVDPPQWRVEEINSLPGED